jgi:hypothetical protein
VRADQNAAAPARLTPKARKASQPLLAVKADTSDTARNAASRISTMKMVIRRADARQQSAAPNAVRSSTSSLVTV